MAHPAIVGLRFPPAFGATDTTAAGRVFFFELAFFVKLETPALFGEEWEQLRIWFHMRHWDVGRRA